MISVVIPLYNKENQIVKTLSTVVNQTYQDFEIIIVNDGSTDGSENEIKKIQDPRIRIIYQDNAGVSAARNHGIEEAKGEFIALLDADDEWNPDYLATQMKLVEKYPQCDVFVTSYEFRDNEGNVTSAVKRKLPFDGPDGVLSNYFEVATSSHPPITSITIMARKKAFQGVGGFPSGVRLGEDLITWAKLACQYKIAFSKKVCATYIFASQAQRLVPKKQPNKIDYVGMEYSKLINEFNIPYLKETAAKWHKMRMVTFVQLQMRKEARKEFSIIQKYIRPSKKDIFWFIMSYMPIQLVHFVLKNKSYFQ